MPSDRDSSGEIRRRRSSHPGGDDDIELDEAQSSGGRGHETTTSGPTTPGHNRSSAVTTPNTTSTASGIDHHSPTSPASPPDPNPKTVRFSTDVERDLDTRRSMSAGGSQINGRWPSGILARPAQKSSHPSLTLNTAGLPTGQVIGEGIVQSPSSMASPDPASRARNSPLSPSGRNRGYSLRRAIFHRNLEDEQRNSDRPIAETQDACSSAEFAAAESAKEPSSPSVAINTVPSGSSSRTSSEPKEKKALPGTAALPNYESWMTRNLRNREKYHHRLKSLYKGVKKFILRIQEIPPSKDGRHVDLDPARKFALVDERTGRPYIDNHIRSTRYSAWDFLPRQLFAQFRKLANFYFLCVSILQMIPGLSTTGTYTTIAPLLFFISISIAKEGYDDLRRHRLDKAENTREASVLHAYKATENGADDVEAPASPQHGPLHWAKLKWKSLKVGDVIKLKRDDPAPADVVLLHATGPNGVAYIETMALDGETNLKSKMAAAIVSKHCKTEEDIANCKAQIVAEDPNADLYNFEGRVAVGSETSPLTTGEIIFRGSVLRNTSEAIGMVIYTGEECRIRMNANKHPRIKAPHLQFVINKIVIIVVCFVIALAIFNTIAYQIWHRTKERRSWYLADAHVAFFPILTSFFVMFNTMIPLSLYVSMEIIKLAQMFLLNDIDMYDEKTDTPFEARTSTINEELGQVSYVFSDKTGTLTDNEMKFRKLSVAGTAWLHDFDIKDENKAKLIHKKRSRGKGKGRKSMMSLASERKKSTAGTVPPDGIVLEERSDSLDKTAEPREEPRWKSSARPGKSQLELRTKDMIRYLQHRPYTAFARKARLFLLSIALCHTALPETRADGAIQFQASSPDELALVRAAQELGYLVVDRDVGTLTLRHPPADDPSAAPVDEVFQILDVIEFSSRRKRMSAVVRFPSGRICVLCKGADSVIMKRLKLASIANKKVAEIEKRTMRRKSLEAQYALARKSEQIERKSSLSRRSLSIRRPSIARRSFTVTQLQPVRDELDSWLNEQEREVEINDLGEEERYYSPRPSAQLGRISMAASEARSSVHLDDWEGLVDESLVNDEAAVIERCFQHVNDFATEGLRTLLYGYRFIEEDEYALWRKQYLEATTSLVDRTNKIERVGEVIEQNFDLAGATAIEDKLQRGVPQAIDKLRRANIKMWMLTGDKRETAINIGHSCRLIKDYSTVVVLDLDAGGVEQSIAAAIVSITKGDIAHSVVVVDGATLSMIEDAPTIEKLFFELTILVDSVICCRASPSQKASLVKSIRKRIKNSVTLAIGDGANDIAMIQEAHVGIGITGKEGLQAARSSDYSIAQFRFLTKLLLVHGRWNYVRTCKYTVGTFWKEMLFYLTQALYQRYAGYTGTSLYENWSLSMFNTLFTSLPVIFLGVFEKDVAASTLLAVPELYTFGQKNRGFNLKVYLVWMFMAASEAIVIFFMMVGVHGLGSAFNKDRSLFALGDLTFTTCVIIIWSKLQAIEMHSKSVIVLISLICCVGGWFLWNIVLSQTYSNNVIYKVRDGFVHGFGHSVSWWFTVLLIVATVIVYELAVHALRTTFLPSDVDTFQEFEHDILIKKRFEEAAAEELQQGWDRGKKRSSVELAREEAEQAAREKEVKELLKNRPDDLGSGQAGANEPPVGSPKPRSSLEVHELLSRRFGSIRSER